MSFLTITVMYGFNNSQVVSYTAVGMLTNVNVSVLQA